MGFSSCLATMSPLNVNGAYVLCGLGRKEKQRGGVKNCPLFFFSIEFFLISGYLVDSKKKEVLKIEY
jgi:hypothetical protein